MRGCAVVRSALPEASPAKMMHERKSMTSDEGDETEVAATVAPKQRRSTLHASRACNAFLRDAKFAL